MEIGEPYTPTVENYTIYACCSGPCSCAKVIYYGSYHVCSHYYHSSVGHSHPVPGSHPHGPYGPISYLTRVLYHIAPCKPLWPVASLTSLDQRGVAQEKWSCGGPRPCLAYGLIILVLPVVWSGHHPSSLDDIIRGSMWNYPNKDPFLYVG